MPKYDLTKIFSLFCFMVVFITLLTGCASDEEIIFENDYVQLKKVEGLSYVFHENELANGEVSYSIAIYNQDYFCGWFGVREAPPEVQQGLEWEHFCAAMSSHGSVEIIEHQVLDGMECLSLDVSDPPFTYGDTEWLVDAGIFADIKEACREEYISRIILWSKDGVDKGYGFDLNPLFISEKQMDELKESVTFKEEAFASEKASEWLAAEGGVPYTWSIQEEIFVRENASRLTYRIAVGERVYCMPEQTVALQVGANEWDIYGYASGGDVKIGTIRVDEDIQISIAPGVVLEEEDFEIHDNKAIE